jgi:hypothetical protein
MKCGPWAESPEFKPQLHQKEEEELAGLLIPGRACGFSSTSHADLPHMLCFLIKALAFSGKDKNKNSMTVIKEYVSSISREA